MELAGCSRLCGLVATHVGKLRCIHVGSGCINFNFLALYENMLASTKKRAEVVVGEPRIFKLILKAEENSAMDFGNHFSSNFFLTWDFCGKSWETFGWIAYEILGARACTSEFGESSFFSPGAAYKINGENITFTNFLIPRFRGKWTSISRVRFLFSPHRHCATHTGADDKNSTHLEQEKCSRHKMNERTLKLLAK